MMINELTKSSIYGAVIVFITEIFCLVLIFFSLAYFNITSFLVGVMRDLVLPSYRSFISDAIQDRHLKINLPLFILFSVCFMIFSNQSFAQNVKKTIPINAQLNVYGDDWECKPDFRKKGEKCIAIISPTNSYLTGRSYGNGWECKNGFKEVDANCIKLNIPENAFLESYGRQWRCNRGYKKHNDKCELVKVPRNAYLTRLGDGWKCEEPFHKIKNECRMVVVPENAYRKNTSLGKGWECRRGFIEMGNKCQLVVVPEHAYLTGNTYDYGWKCNRGYQSNGNICVPISIPENAHLDYSGNDWECDPPFKNNDVKCLP